MRKFIEVTKHTGGRTITQRYPERTVGPRAAFGELDYACGECGYHCCSCPEPPAPVVALPEGWIRGVGGEYDHVSGASVSLRVRTHDGRKVWCWWPAGTRGAPECTDPKPTRDAAMAAALASVQPAQPELRPGWTICGGVAGYEHVSRARVWQGGSSGRWYVENVRRMPPPGESHPTLEAAMVRAEQLAELEGPR